MRKITSSALIEGEAFSMALSKWHQDKLVTPSLEVLLPLQNMVSYAGSLSRYFWPSSKKTIHQERAARLRKAFQVSEESPLKNRDVRNGLEHFDEKLDTFLNSFPTGHFLPPFVGSSTIKTNPYEHIFIAFFVDRKTFFVMNKEIEIGPLAMEIARIDYILESCLKNGGRLPMA
ncbi:MAG: hypothetical protein H6603_09430 [Flavobacteriales bacterium]|nr:hypothetical protein [Flavobacteriales bacterium]